MLLHDARRDARGRAGWATSCSSRTRTAHAGIATEIARAGADRGARLADGHPGAVPAPGRDRGACTTIARRAAARPTGGRSSRSTARSRASRRRRSSSSIAASPWRWRSVPSAASRAWTPSADALADYPYLHAARADLLRRMGRRAEAADAYRRAVALTENDAERRFLERQLATLSAPTEAGAPALRHPPGGRSADVR